ncbi:MAG TPA: 2-dehydropantoate 2-reductase [Steroidobacteraceae bacterium]|jgi:2-dehydropantoate 2-reductase
MRILVVGAGAIGGYFGGRLLQAKRDVTFLVRARRATQLRESGLVIQSPLGDAHIPDPPTVQAAQLSQPFDLILLSCKAYDLDAAIESFAPAVGPQTAILPILNGMRHLDVLATKFGKERVLGGQCLISASLDPTGRILHFNDHHKLTFGELDGTRSARVTAILAELTKGGFNASLSEAILQDMWEKWIFIAAAAGITCLMRGAIGDIMSANGPELALALLVECAEIAASAGFQPRESALQAGRTTLTTSGSPLMASMLRDIERGAQTEVEQILGDLLRRRATPAKAASVLSVAYAHIKTYEARRARELSV